MKISFLTFPEGHLVSDIEFVRLKKGFSKVGVDLVRGFEPDCDVVMVKGWSHTWAQVKDYRKPVIYYSIGAEWKANQDLEVLNEPIAELYSHADMVIHISEYCKESHVKALGHVHKNEHVVIPACESNLKETYPALDGKIRLATTCIPRPVKRVEQTEELCKKFDIELVPAYGSVSDFSYYHDCHGYVSLSRKEGMPNNVLEALSYGLPCIVTNYGGGREAVGDAGIVIKNDPEDVPWDIDNIEPVDPVLFGKAIEDFRKNYDRLRLKARERVKTTLNDYVMAYKFKELIQPWCKK